MKTVNELNSEIIKITMKIEELFPELSKYIGEMPVKISYAEDCKIESKNLEDYLNSLNDLLINYISNNKSITE